MRLKKLRVLCNRIIYFTFLLLSFFTCKNEDDRLISNKNVSQDCINPNLLVDDLVIYMPFANQAKDLVSETLATGWNGDMISNTFVEDRDGNSTCAISFSANNEITIPVTIQNQLIQGNSYSISIWFKMQNTNATDLEIFFRKPGNATQGFQLGVYDLNAPLFSDNLGTSIWDNDWNQQVDVQWQNTDWHHLVATVDSNNTIKLYRDGILKNSIDNSNFSTGSGQGNLFVLGENFKGYFDDLRVYKKVLSLNEVSVLFNLEADCYDCL